VLTSLGGLAVDASGPFGSVLFERLVVDGTRLFDLVADDAALSAYLDEVVTGVWHASGTCRMGRADDIRAVTDHQGRVYGVAGLRVCDAS
ncbi:GMC oxidoreductase, partial [Escherichia coli]|uniref:GMC oxidoreductase n=1 Tax=Escherichia coli TaxID=562 RepID=UPI001BDC82A8